MNDVPGQLKRAWNASIKEDPKRWGFEAHRVTRELVLRPMDDEEFPLNVDGSTMVCRGAARITIAGQIQLLGRIVAPESIPESENSLPGWSSPHYCDPQH